MKYFVEYALGNVSNRNNCIPLKDLNGIVKLARHQSQDLYRSYYMYDESIEEHFKVYKTIRSYKGDYYLDTIKLDVDKGKKGETEEEDRRKDNFLHEKTKLLVKDLIDEWEVEPETIQCWYSGSGFHIIFPDIFHFQPSRYLPHEVKATLNKYFPGMDSMPLMPTGLFRVGYTLNYKTGRYKTPFTVEELREFTIQEIIEISKLKATRKVHFENETNKDYNHLIIKDQVERAVVSNKSNPTRIVTCVQKMFDDGAREGSRHEVLLRLVGSWRMKGMHLPMIKILAKEWNNGSLNEYELFKQVEYFYEKGYNPGCDDVVRKRFCDSKCIHYETKNYSVQINDMATMEAKTALYYKSNYREKSFNLREIYPAIGQDYWCMPCELITLVGMPKVGKSAFVQNLIVKLKKFKVLYLNFEFGDILFYRRLVQIEHGMKKEEVEAYYKEHHNSLGNNLKHISVIEFPPFIDDIANIITMHNPDILVVDTVDEIVSKRYKDEISKTTEVAMTLKKIATQFEKIIICVNHVPKSSCYDQYGKLKKLNIHSAKGSSATAQKSDKIIAFEGDPNTAIRTLTSLGARDEKSFDIEMMIDWETFRIF